MSGWLTLCLTSHRGLLHLIMNCLALEGFGESLRASGKVGMSKTDDVQIIGSAAYYFLVKEQVKQQPPMLESTATFHFLSFFLSGMYLDILSSISV